ncbi:MAG: carboxypeptidase-like regulatory domain-containing protein, partial [Opitutales bacterium]
MKTQYLKFTIIALACFLCGSIVNAIKIEIPKELKDDLEAQKAADKAALEEKLEQSEVQSQESPNGGQMSFGAGENQGQSGDTDASTGEDGQSANDGQLETFTFDAGNLEEGEGRIAGQIFDKDTGQPLRGVAILIEGTDIGTITDSQGRYRLNNVQSGEYTLSIVKSGYIEATVTETKVTEGELMKLDFALPPRPAEMSDEVYVLEGLTVTAAEAISQNVALLALRQTSIASIDALSSEDFSKFAASDVAEAVTRISGASLSDGKYIVVRGLNDRYNTVLINGVRLPSPDPDRKAVALDIFPTSLIDSIVARKTYTSDMPGESSGGSVEMRTKSIPDEPFIKFSFSAGGQYTSSDTDTFLADPEQIGLLDWLQGDDNRGYSVSDQDDTLLSNYPNTVGNQNFPLMAPVRKGMNKFGDRSYSLSFGGSKRFSDWFSVGAIFGTKVSEKKRSSFKELNRITFESGNAVLSQTALKEDGQGILKGEEEYSASVLLGLGFEIADHTTINYNYFNTASLTSTAEISSYSQFITDAGQANGQNIPDGINIFNDFEVGSEERSLEAHQFSGEHRFENVVFDSDWVFSWYYTEAAMEQSEPDQRQISEYFTEFEGFSTNPGLPPVARYQRDTEQESQMYGIDLQQTYEIGDFATFNLHIGFDQEESERMFQQLETLGGNTVQEPLYMALPAPDGARGFIGQVFEESILGRNGADGQDGIDAVIRSLYDSRIEPLPGRISARQADLVSLESALSAAESLFS